ncbi:MAG TPA: heterodisulfide reductase-related iron-sulfur binding cluster [Acidimicrobiia bacterium]|nr:heterodisulfide reductase-related iron-sulfur binding cluster [Acidimicrobiia bacterium]
MPDPALIKTCIHCGFCLPTCPTYVVWGEEMDSPRGRIVLMRQAQESGGDLAAAAVHFDRCLGCMACVTACPSGVRYDVLIEQTRPELERSHTRTPADRAFRRFCFEVFTHPGRLRAGVPLLVAGRRLGLDQRLRRGLDSRGVAASVPSGPSAPSAGDGRRFRRLAAMMRLTPDVKLSATWRRLPERTPASPSAAPARGTVGLLQGCVARVFFARTNEATVRVLSAEGFDVVVPAAAGCCGALFMHSGAETEAQERARATIAAFEGCETVAVNAAGCGSAMKEYGRLLAGDPEWAERAEAFAAKVADVTEVLARAGPRAPRHPVPLTVAYHDACHLAHAQGVRAEPRAVLASVPGLTVVEPAEWEICCGSAGLYNLLEPEPAAELGRRKVANLAATGAAAVVAGNPGCALQIAAHSQRKLPVYHPVEILDASISRRSLP